MACSQEIEQDVCEFCFTSRKKLVDPKRLPCGHSYCMKCLRYELESFGMIACPSEQCGKVYADLSCAAEVIDDESLCDVCSPKCSNKKPADIYCDVCKIKYCCEHEKNHRALFVKHKTLDMESFKLQRENLIIFKCEVHKEYTVTLACLKCMELFCVQCLNVPTNCGDTEKCCVLTPSVPHDIVALETVVNEIQNWFGANYSQKEKELSLLEVLKAATRVVLEYSEETALSVKNLCEKKNCETEAAVISRYEKLETLYIDSRKEVLNQLENFVNEVQSKFDEMRCVTRKFEQLLAEGNQLSIIRSYKSTQKQLSQLTVEAVPILATQKLIQLEESFIDTVDMVEVDGFVISNKVRNITQVPSSITRIKTIELGNNGCPYPLYATYYQRSIYLLMSDTNIVEVNKCYEHSTVGQLAKPNQKVILHKNKVYSAKHGSLYIPVIDFTSHCTEEVTEQTNETVEHDQCAVVACENNIVVVCSSGSALEFNVYDENASKKKTFEICTSISTFSVCSAGSDAIVLSDFDRSRVFKMNLLTEEIVWEQEMDSLPHGVANYREKYILVVCPSDDCEIDTLSVLDIVTGNCKGIITPPEPLRYEKELSYIHIKCAGDELIAFKAHQSKISIWKLLFY